MTYNPSIPQPSDLISNSQSDILDNFSVINTDFGEDHVAFTEGSNQGKHDKVTSVGQASHLAPAIATDILLYSYEESTETGTIHFSTGAAATKSEVPTPLTAFHGTEVGWAGGGSFEVFDCTGLGVAAIDMYCWRGDGKYVWGVALWDGSSFVNSSASSFNQLNQSSPTTLKFKPSGSKILVENTGAIAAQDTWWTLTPKRLQV